MKILCGIVLYNPDLDCLKNNIECLVGQVEEVFLVNNGNYDNDLDTKIKSIENIKITIKHLNKNMGIAYALNCILKYSLKYNYDFLLTMDQDSRCDVKIISSYLSEYEENVALYTPQIIDINKNEEIQYNKTSYVNMCITSGCFMNLKYINGNSCFDNHFFIDFVDFDFSLNLIEQGYKIKFVSNAIIYHQLGNAKKINSLSRLLKKDFYTFNHNSIRTFYYNRNAILLLKKHPKMPSKKQHILSLIKWDLLKIVYEDDKLNKLNSIIWGLICGGIE